MPISAVGLVLDEFFKNRAKIFEHVGVVGLLQPGEGILVDGFELFFEGV